MENVFSDMMKAGKVGCLLLVCLSLAVMTTALGDSTGDLASARLIRSEGSETYKKMGGHFRRRGDKNSRDNIVHLCKPVKVNVLPKPIRRGI